MYIYIKNNILFIVQGKLAAFCKNFGFFDSSPLCVQYPPVPSALFLWSLSGVIISFVSDPGVLGRPLPPIELWLPYNLLASEAGRRLFTVLDKF